MKKKHIHIVTLLYFVMLLQSTLLYANIPSNSPFCSNPISNEDPCEGPAPGWVVTTNITPTSVSLLWEAPQLNLYYKVDVTDLTLNAPVGTYFTNVNYLTVSGLISGHIYRFDVSSSYCPMGLYGDSIYTIIPTIIIDFTIELQNPCRPDVAKPTGANVQYTFCVEQSAPGPPYTNGFIGAFQYSGNTIEFGVAVEGTEVHVGKLEYNNIPYYFTAVNSSTVECKYNNTLLFTLSEMSVANSFSDASVKITFSGNYGDIFTCNNGCPAERPGDGAGEHTGSVGERNQKNDLSPAINPNPFSLSTRFGYSLESSGPVEVVLYDATGRQVRIVERAEWKDAGQYETFIDGADLPAGAYFLQANMNQTKNVYTLIKLDH